ncbi:hypothetical protein RP20_CCG018486 [Aedes albopictus]|nr:hypothetical protein RP20_CCG018486 [Aedes albopictus]
MEKHHAIPLEKFASEDSPLLAAVVKIAGTLEKGVDSMSEKEFRFAQALYELVSEFRERIEEECQRQDLDVFQTRQKMKLVNHAKFCAAQLLIKARGGMK